MRHYVRFFIGKKFVKDEYKEIFDVYLKSLIDEKFEKKYLKLREKNKLSNSTIFHSVLKDTFDDEMDKKFPGTILFSVKLENNEGFVILDKKIKNQNSTTTGMNISNAKNVIYGQSFEGFDLIDLKKIHSFGSVSTSLHGGRKLIEIIENHLLILDDTNKTYPELGFLKKNQKVIILDS